MASHQGRAGRFEVRLLQNRHAFWALYVLEGLVSAVFFWLGAPVEQYLYEAGRGLDVVLFAIPSGLAGVRLCVVAGHTLYGEDGDLKLLPLCIVLSTMIAGAYVFLALWTVNRRGVDPGFLFTYCGLSASNMLLSILSVQTLVGGISSPSPPRSSSPRSVHVARAVGTPWDAEESFRRWTRRSRDGAEEDLAGWQCSICMGHADKSALLELKCSHIFHSECIIKWICVARRGCPMRCQEGVQAV